VVLHLRAQGLEEGDEQHPPMLSCGAWSTLPLPLVICATTLAVASTENCPKGEYLLLISI